MRARLARLVARLREDRGQALAEYALLTSGVVLGVALILVGFPTVLRWYYEYLTGFVVLPIP